MGPFNGRCTFIACLRQFFLVCIFRRCLWLIYLNKVVSDRRLMYVERWVTLHITDLVPITGPCCIITPSATYGRSVWYTLSNAFVKSLRQIMELFHRSAPPPGMRDLWWLLSLNLHNNRNRLTCKVVFTPHYKAVSVNGLREMIYARFRLIAFGGCPFKLRHCMTSRYDVYQFITSWRR